MAVFKFYFCQNYSLPIADAKSHPEDALAWLIKAKSSAGTKTI